MVNKIYLFRHGQTTYNRDKIFTGFKDAKLSPAGKRHAKVIAHKLRMKNFQFAFQTKLSRSKDSLRPILDEHPECVGVIEDDRMIERSYGSLEGKKHSAIIKKYGNVQFEKWHRGFDVRPPKGESFTDVEKRVRSFINDLRIFIKKNKVNVVISSHGNSIRLFRKVMEGLSENKTEKIDIPYDKVYEYSV